MAQGPVTPSPPGLLLPLLLSLPLCATWATLEPGLGAKLGAGSEAERQQGWGAAAGPEQLTVPATGS